MLYISRISHEKHIKCFSHASDTRSVWGMGVLMLGGGKKMKQFGKLNFIVEYVFFFFVGCVSSLYIWRYRVERGESESESESIN